jgi:hypothetical protein
VARVRRPRYRKHRRRSRRFTRFLAAMTTKWDGEETPIDVDTVGSDVLALAGTPDALGPYTLRGAPPPELRAVDRFWLTVDGSDNATIYSSRADLAAGRAAIPLASWALDVDFDSLTATTATVASVDDATDEITTTVAHGFVTGDGPLRATTTDTLPAGLATATDYYAIRVSATELQLAATRADAVAAEPVAVDITDAGTGTHTLTLAGVDVTDNTLRMVAHGMQTGDGPVTVITAGVLPTGLAVLTSYYVIRADANYVKLATSRANALAGTAVNITAIGSGDHGLVRALEIGKDFSADGLIEWLEQGVPVEVVRDGLVADVDTIFT